MGPCHSGNARCKRRSAAGRFAPMTPLLFLAGCALLALAGALTTRLLDPDSAVDAAVTFGVVVTAGVSAMVLGTGAVGLLEPGVVLALQAVWAAAAAVLVARRAPPRPTLPQLRWGEARRHPWATA